MLVKVARFDPDTKKSWIQEYTVDTAKQEMTVMDVLDYISNNIDHSLAYYRHSICNHGICGRCSVTVNGKVCLACIEPIAGYESLELAPVSNRILVRDLVTEMNPPKKIQ